MTGRKPCKPSVRARGVLVPLIVRPLADDAGQFEIVAGKRRFCAAQAAAEESRTAEPLPCAVMAPGDDAAALEASLIENMARLDPDEVTRWESFTRLAREGRTPEQVAKTLGLDRRAATDHPASRRPATKTGALRADDKAGPSARPRVSDRHGFSRRDRDRGLGGAQRNRARSRGTRETPGDGRERTGRFRIVER